MSGAGLAEAFVAALAGPLAHQVAKLEDLGGVLQDIVSDARSAWPELELDPGTFVAFVAERLSPEDDLTKTLPALPADALYLTCACTQGNQRAIAALEQAYGRFIDRGIAKVKDRHLLPDDFKQLVRIKLYVGAEGGVPGISRYSGQGSLAAWLGVASMRTALNAVRARRVETQALPHNDALLQETAAVDPELDHLRRVYQDVFKDEFAAAVGRLTARERTLLRMSVVEHLTVRQLATMYGVHHATAARWVARAKDSLVQGIRDGLAGRLQITQRRLQGIMALIQSQLDVSIARVLRQDQESTAS